MKKTSPTLTFSFDIGHSSIGWAVLQAPQEGNAHPDILAAGTVIFQAEDCQSQLRAGFRRQRRHIAATRNRIKRLTGLLEHVGAMSNKELKERHCAGGGHSFPWLLSARVLTGGKLLTWPELWDVLRWYAHNRGYDGNALWTNRDMSDDPDEKGDTEKVANAMKLMADHKCQTMAETVCAFLGLDPKADNNPAPEKYFKGSQAAFPRNVVVAEVRRLLERHVRKLPGLTEDFIRALLDDWAVARTALGSSIRLPGRYQGGLLFGQMVPRFDNRIIPNCRISGEKTPDRHCRAFYRYRWGMLMNNFRKLDPLTERAVPLSGEERSQLHKVMEEVGYFNKTSLKKALTAIGVELCNLEQLFLTPEMEKALVYDPVKRELASSPLKEVWPHIPERWQKVFAGELYKGRIPNMQRPTLARWRERMQADRTDLSGFDAALDGHLQKLNGKKSRSQKAPQTSESLLNRELRLNHKAEGRSPYSRSLMEKAWEAILTGHDPKARNEDGSYGCLAETPEVVSRQWKKNMDQQTNNHLVRHRMLVFQKLLKDMTVRYAQGKPETIDKVVVEVVRDLREFSGKTAKEKAQMLGIKLSDHRAAADWLEKQRDEMGVNFPITAGLIKKTRIARDMNWVCPFTGKAYSLQDILGDRVDREHIIPRSLRPSDSLESLVLTFREINQWKGQRTALKFIEDTANDSRTLSPSEYEKHIEKLSVRGGSDDDMKRRVRRKGLLLMRDYKSGEKEFTGRDLTQTSQLNKLAAFQALGYFADLVHEEANPVVQPHQIMHMAGSVTAAVRRAWRIEGCLAMANPAILDESGKALPKGEIRGISHLHHALDAASLGLASWYFPKNGRLWEFMSRRRLLDTERAEMCKLMRMEVTFNHDGQFSLPDLSAKLKEQLTSCLAEKRVVMHLPGTYRGLKVQQNTWGIRGKDPKDPKKITITQAMRNQDGVRVRKLSSEKASKLLGVNANEPAGKLARLNGALIVEANYGVALMATGPEVIPHMNVHRKLRELKEQNEGRMPPVLRNGYVIRIESGAYQGLWRIHSIKDASAGFLMNIGHLDIPRVANKTPGCKMNVRVNTLIKDGLHIVQTDYTGAEM